ncbi:MAG: GNAT family N-acetyltransferase [Gemmatimonadales bacterium]|nr:GNAT family N-acetyltransferase [Gemmatimonadales bacterium]NIN13078.1 GNAT family N-acetyltransferase [Gemmatimonadales bacterium]NIN51162.1 GNAT family N-acetyltransferase [Gemmatimonadales bacterium]NIP08626.1 GNAT family N-acetyltransferase [Gemmatimonadales bacterium]NIR02314.1 GNAT family N-acetyltransferase [Gemmatimonadales bacterium]
MLRPERTLVGPRTASLDDVPAMNRVFSEAFTDRYRRDGLVGVRVPRLNADIWHYAISDSGDGAMLWCDERDEVVAFNIAHCSGSEGWMGPLAVRTDRQGMGVGRVVVETAIEWLHGRAVRTLGLETMPRTVENIGFYAQLGFLPKYLTITMTGEASRRRVAGEFCRLGRLASSDRAAMLQRCRDRLDRSAPGCDFGREIDLTEELGIGDTIVLQGDQEIAGFALWHSAPLAEARAADELRVLKLFADSGESFVRLLVALEACAAALRVRRVAIRCQTGYSTAYRLLTARGYRVRWTDLRMTLEQFPEAVLPAGEVLFSNWEI